MRKQLLLGTVVAGMLAASVSGMADEAKKDAGGKDIECHGGNMCKGKGDCGGPGYSCAGNNSCKGKGFVTVKSQEECDKLIAKVKASEKHHGPAKKKSTKSG